MYFVFIYYAYVYNVLHFILNKSINQSKFRQIHAFDRTLKSFVCSNCHVLNAKEAANYTLSISAFLRGTKSIPLSEAARQSKNVHGSEALHYLC